MTTWNIAVPSGKEIKDLGASRIRANKLALQTALQNQGIFPGGTPASPVFIPTILQTATTDRPPADSNFSGRWCFNSTTQTIQRDNGTSWDNLTSDNSVIPAGSRTIFIESTAPTGWTQVTSGINDSLIRTTISAGLGGSGGTATVGDSVSSPPTHNHGGASGSTEPLHTHTMTFTTAQASSGTPYTQPVIINLPTTGNEGSAIAHTHSITGVVGFSPKYINGIVCTKN